jgi:hypothetical protein
MGKGLLGRFGLRSRSPLSLEIFREQVIEVLLLEHPDAAVDRWDRDGIGVRWTGASSEFHSFSVGPAYAWYLQQPHELIAAVQHVAAVILISSVRPSLEALAIVVKGSRYNPKADPEDPALVRPLISELVAVAVIDNPYGYQNLTASRLRGELGLSDEALWERAMQNTLERLDIDCVPMERNGPTKLLRGDGLATSLLLIDEFWDPPRQDQVLIAAPIAPNKLVVAAERDTRSLKVLRQMMRSDPLDAEWRQFRGLLVRREGRWDALA